MMVQALMLGTSMAWPASMQRAMGMQQRVDCCMPSHQQTAARKAAKRRRKSRGGMQLVAAAAMMSPSRKYSTTKSFFFIVDNDNRPGVIQWVQYNRRKVASDVAVELIILQIILDLDVQIVGVQLEGVVLQRAQTVPEGGQFLRRLLALADVVAGRDLQDAVDAGVVVLEGFGRRDRAVEGVEGLGVEDLAHRLLVGGPVRLQVLELGEELEHLFADERDILIEELLDGVGAEVEEHGEVLEGGGVGGLVDVDDVGEDLSEVVVDVVVETPLDLAEEVAVEDEFVDVHEQLAADALEQSLQRVLEVVLAAEGPAHDRLDQLLHRVELRLQVVRVLLRVGRRGDLQDEVQRLPFFAFGLCPLHPKVQQISDPRDFIIYLNKIPDNIQTSSPTYSKLLQNSPSSQKWSGRAVGTDRTGEGRTMRGRRVGFTNRQISVPGVGEGQRSDGKTLRGRYVDVLLDEPVLVPHALDDLAFLVCILAPPVLLIVPPETSEGLPVAVEKSSLPFHLVVNVAALVPPPVLPLHHAASLQLVQRPLPAVFLLPRPAVLREPVDEVVHEVPLTVAAVAKLQVSLPVLVPLLPLALVVFPVVVYLDPRPLLPPRPELPLIDTPRPLLQLTHSVHLPFQELALETVLIGECEDAPAAHIVVRPLPLVHAFEAAVATAAVSLSTHPLPCVRFSAVEADSFEEDWLLGLECVEDELAVALTGDSVQQFIVLLAVGGLQRLHLEREVAYAGNALLLAISQVTVAFKF